MMRYFLISCLLFSLILTIYFVQLMVRYPYAGVDARPVTHQGMTVYYRDQYGWTGRLLQKGDILLSVDGHPVSAGDRRTFSHMHTLAWSHNGMLRDASFSLLSSPQGLLIHYIVPILFFVICFGMGVFLLVRRWRGRAEPELIMLLAAIGPVFVTISARSGIDG